MGKRLLDNLNSRYLNAANRMRPNGAQKRIVAYVESYDDVFFWRSVLEEFETDEIRFEVMLPSQTNLSKGKKNVMMNQLGENLGECMIACVDADYDYLLQGVTECSRQLNNNPYIFHTYVYAIESYQCYAPGLHEVCVMATLNDHDVMNFEAFLKDYSEIIYPLFAWNIWAYRYNKYKEFTMTDFNWNVTFHDINPYHPEKTLDYVRRKVNQRMAQLQDTYPQARTTYPKLKKELTKLGVTPQNCYLYIQGHSLMEGVVLPVLGPICSLLRKEREREINNLAVHEKQRQNELASYQHSQSDVALMLRKATNFKNAEQYQNMRLDIEEFISSLSQHLQSE